MSSTGGLMIMAGGTGGHVFPALAVANELKAKQINVRWMGTRRGLEAKVVPAANIPIDWITIEGLRGSRRLSLIAAPFKLLRALWQSLRILRQHKPDLVLGMGGFVAGPGGVAARMMGCPLLIHEQNAVAGLTNRYLAKIADRVLTGFPHVMDMPAHSEWVGNPVRSDIGQAKFESSAQKSRLNLLVIGGSQGAVSLNRHLPSAFLQAAQKLYKEQDMQLHVWHQSGRGRKQGVEEAYEENAVYNFRVSEFIDDMPSALGWADLVVCRAGAMTIAELCAAAKPSVLVPFPFSAGDHQDRNAEFLLNAGAAYLVKNAELQGDVMPKVLAQMFNDVDAMRAMGAKAHALHKPDALGKVVRVCEKMLNA